MKTRLCIAALAVVPLFLPAQAEDCGKLVSYGTIPLTQIEGIAAEFVPVEIAGAQKLMLLDTGADVTTLSNKTAAELKLDTTRNSNIRIYDVTGAMSDQFVKAPLKIGAMRGDKVNFMLGTVHLDDFSDPRVAGRLGADILDKFDLSVDYGAHTVALLDQNHCEGQVVYWPERPIAVITFDLVQGSALQSVRAEYQRRIDEPTPRVQHIGELLATGGLHIIFPVMLDGVEIMAQLDTGDSISILEQKKAERSFGIVVGSPDTPAASVPNGAPIAWKHRFKSLSLAGIAVSNPEVLIVPDKVSEHVNTWSTGTLLDNRANSAKSTPSLLLGRNVLKQLHIYIAYKEQKIYITAAGTPKAN